MGEYRTAQVIQQANPAIVLVDAIIDMCNAHPGWVHEGSFVLDTNYTNHVFKSLGSVNAHGQDFYVIITTYATYAYVQVAETMSQHPTIPTARRFGRIAPTPANGSRTPTAVTNAFDDNSVVVNSSSYLLATSTSTFTYRILATNNALILAVGDAAYYAGLFEPFWDHANEFPLVLLNIGSGSNTYGHGSFTREPGEDASLSYAFMAFMEKYTPYFGNIGGVAVSSRPGPIGSRIMLSRYGNITGKSGRERGLLYDTLCFNHNNQQLSGDTITMSNGDTYELIGLNREFGWVNKDVP